MEEFIIDFVHADCHGLINPALVMKGLMSFKIPQIYLRQTRKSSIFFNRSFCMIQLLYKFSASH